MAKTAAPKSKARMSRKQPKDSWPGRRLVDPKEAYTTEQLAEIGAIALMWNQIDILVDWLLKVALDLPTHLFYDIGRRLGFDGKIDILRRSAENSVIFSKDAWDCIKITLDAVSEYKKYRDRIVHSVPYNLDLGIVHMMNYRAELYQSLVTIDALKALFQRMKLVFEEMQQLELLYRLADENGARAVYHREAFDPLERRRTRDVPIQIKETQKRQQDRLSLPPLPLFPEESSVPPWMVDRESHPDSAETDLQS